LYAKLQVENIAGHNNLEREKERARERGERMRDSVRLVKGCGIGYKFDH
jgi:hypothetical protein